MFSNSYRALWQFNTWLWLLSVINTQNPNFFETYLVHHTFKTCSRLRSKLQSFLSNQSKLSCRTPKLIEKVDGKAYSLTDETTTRKAVQSLYTQNLDFRSLDSDYREKRHFFFVTLLDRSCVIHQIVGRVSVNTNYLFTYGNCFKWRAIEFLDQTGLVV